MKKKIFLILVITMISSMAGADETNTFFQELVIKTTKAMAMVRCEITDDSGTQTLGGTAVCIDSNSGLMMTTALDTRLKPETISKLEVLIPGQPAKAIKAKLLGIDPITGLSFLQVTGDHKFSSIAFMKTANTPIGQRVVSVCLTGNQSAVSPVFGTGFVAFKQRRPEWTFFVTGGRLSPIGSVVFDSKGRAIGIVGPQPFQRFQSSTQRGTIKLSLKSIDQAIAFLPVEEFVHVLQNIPQDGKVRRVPWLGVINFTPVQPELVATKGISSPAIMVGRIVPDSAADKAGLVPRDMIIAVNDKPLEELSSPNLTVAGFRRKIAKFGSGKTVKLTVFSGSEKHDLNVVLSPMPKLPSEAAKLVNKTFGMLLREKVPLDSFLDTSPTAAVPGLLVIAVAENSPAFKGGLRKDDVITAINGTSIKAVEDGKKVFNDAIKPPAVNVSLTLRRGYESQNITIQIPSTKK